jgi:hypothetical protein
MRMPAGYAGPQGHQKCIWLQRYRGSVLGLLVSSGYMGFLQMESEADWQSLVLMSQVCARHQIRKG